MSTVNQADQSNNTPWWEAAFGDHYDVVYAHRSDAAATEEVAGLVPRLIEAGGLVCDACCGNGRHLAAMRRVGLQVVGFDYSRHLLQTARQRPDAQGQVLRADIRHLPLAQASFDAVTLLFTAFGYFDDDSNVSVLSGLAEIIRAGGLLVIDLPDVDHLRANLVPESERRSTDGTLIHERRHLRGSHVIKDVVLTKDDREVGAWQECVRLYQRDEVIALADPWFTVRDSWRSLRGPDGDEQRTVVWLQRR